MLLERRVAVPRTLGVGSVFSLSHESMDYSAKRRVGEGRGEGDAVWFSIAESRRPHPSLLPE